MASPIYSDLLSAAPTGTTGASRSVPDGGAEYTLVVWGTFDAGTTATLQMTPDNGTTWLDVPSASFTAAGILTFKPAGFALRGVVSGGTAPSINMRMFRGGNT